MKLVKKKSGFTLTEAAIVLGIIGVILGAIWAAVHSLYTRERIHRAAKDILAIVQNVRSVHGMSQNTMLDMAIAGTAGAEIMARSGVIPSDMWAAPDNPAIILHPWRGQVTFDALATSTDGDSFRIGLLAVPQAECADLLVRLTGATRDELMIEAGTTTASQPRALMPIDLPTAAGDCANPSNDLFFSFLLKG